MAVNNLLNDFSDASSSCMYPVNKLPMASISQLATATDDSAWANYKVIPKRPLRTLLKRMFEQGVNPNIAVMIDDQRYFCHSLVLRAVSTFFRNLETVRVVHLPGDQVTPRAFVYTYAWALNDKTYLQRNVLVEIFRAAKFLGVHRLLELCWACFEDAANSEDQAVLLYEEAKTLHVCINDVMFARICRFFLGFVATQEFQELSEDDVCNLLARTTIGVNTEMEVFMAAIVWLSYKWPERKPFTKQLLNCVRFTQLPFMFLLTFRKRRDSVVIVYIATSSFIDQLLQDGITKNSDCTQQCRCNVDYTQTRLWIYDAKCKYHHAWHCKAMLYLTYDCFLDYLEQLQTYGPNHWTTLKDCTDENIKCCARCPSHHVLSDTHIEYKDINSFDNLESTSDTFDKL